MFINAVVYRALQEYLEYGSLSRASKILIKICGEYCGEMQDETTKLAFKLPLSKFALSLSQLELR